MGELPHLVRFIVFFRLEFYLCTGVADLVFGATVTKKQ